jgi:signal transduction histidine kinase
MQKTFDSVVLFLTISTLIILVLAFFIITIIYLYRKKQILYSRGLEQLKSDYDRTILSTQLEIQEQTFQTISRDIHDNINLSLTLAKLNLNTLDIENKEKSSFQINASIDFVSKAITDLTDISRSMNSDIIIEQGLISALQIEIEKLRKLEWFILQFEVTGNSVFLDAQKELFIFRIVQEAFNNILKHAQAKTVILGLHYGNDDMTITIADDGVGFTKLDAIEKRMSRPTAGLLNMQKRTELMNGNWQIESGKGKGTTIKFSIPFCNNKTHA